MARKGENIFKRKDGRWEARYICYYENGKARYRYLYGATYKEVRQKKYEELQKKNVYGLEKLQKSKSFSMLATEWLTQIKQSVKESTYTRYHWIIEKYLIPLAGKEEPESVDTLFLTEIQTKLLEGGSIGGKALAPKTVTDILCVMKSILRYGKEHGIACPELGRMRYPKQQKKKITVVPEETRQSLEQHLLKSEDTVSLGILVTLFTGVRIGELCGLRWEDVDFVNGTITVNRTVERIADLSPLTSGKTKVVICAPKTENAVRSIPLPQFLLEYLKKCRKEDVCYLVTGTIQYTEPHQFYVRYQKYLEKHAYGKYTFHALRHTFATRCVELGFDVKSLSEILGHADVTTTLSVYVHPSMQQKKSQMERLTPLGFSQSKL